MGSLPVNAREELVASLEGQKALIPDLRPLLSHWPQKANPHEERLEKDVDAYLHKYDKWTSYIIPTNGTLVSSH